MKIKKILMICSLCFSQFFIFAETEGELLFKKNKPEQAVEALEREISSNTAGGDAYNYLGLAYYQLGQYEKSVYAFEDGLKSSKSSNKKVLAYNQGNSYYALKDYKNAARCYSFALEVDGRYTDALLNRANAYLMDQKYDECIEDYTKYLKLEPKNEQREKIKQLLALLRNEQKRIAKEAEENAKAEKLREQEELARMEQISPDDLSSDDYELSQNVEDYNSYEERLSAEQERMLMEDAELLEQGRLEELQRSEAARLAEEQQKALEKQQAADRLSEEERLNQEKMKEEFRLTEERLMQYEMERRRKLLEEVANSLNSESTNMSNGVEGIMDYEQTPELD